MYVSVVNCLSILLCVVTIASRCGSDSGQPSGPSTAAAAAAAVDHAAAAEGGGGGGEAENQETQDDGDGGGDGDGQAAAAAAAAGRRRQTQPQTFEILNPRPTDVAIECKALRSKRYITDGFCTSVKPIEDMVCTGNCLPIGDLPWYAEFIKVWSRAKTLQYRCVDDVVRYKKVTFSCDSGETRSYKIRVVRSCKCKRYLRNQNESPADNQPKRTNNRGQQQRPKKLSNLSDDPK